MLPNYLYMVIVFRFYYELSNKEIEAITGIPSNKISSMVQTAIKMLRERYTTMEHVDKVNQVEQVEHKNDEGDKGDNSQSP
jgi:DNA-directed RNA polymerase specialized sigma24 family protein